MSKPTILKLLKTISSLKSKENQFQNIPYGGSNPYSYCSACRRSMIEVSYDGHFAGCARANIQIALKNFEQLYQKELGVFLESRAYLSKSFKNYCWFKQDQYVEGLSTLQNEIEKHQKKFL